MACCGVSWVLIFTYAIISENLFKFIWISAGMTYSDLHDLKWRMFNEYM